MAPVAPAQSAIPVPTTRQELDQLGFRTGDIKNQLGELAARRKELLEQTFLLPENSRSDHLGRIAAIDQRAAKLERELFMTEDAIAQAARRGVSPERSADLKDGIASGLLQEQQARDVRDMVGNASREAVFGSVFGILAMYMLYRGFRRFIWRRKSAPGLPDYGPQIAQLQQSIDVIALEVERISEGQRYVAKVLSDRGAIGPGSAEPVSVAQGEGVAHRRG